MLCHPLGFFPSSNSCSARPAPATPRPLSPTPPSAPRPALTRTWMQLRGGAVSLHGLEAVSGQKHNTAFCAFQTKQHSSETAFVGFIPDGLRIQHLKKD